MRSQALVVVLALLGVLAAGLAAAYAVFSDTLQVSATVGTGVLRLEFRQPPYGIMMFDDCSNNKVDMIVPNYDGLSSVYAVYDNAVPYEVGGSSVSVACGTAKLIETQSGYTEIDVELVHVYPYYMNGLYFTLYNSGTIPAKLVAVIVKTPDGRSYTFTPQQFASGVQIDVDGDGKPDVALWSDGLTTAASDVPVGKGLSSMLAFVVTPYARPGSTLSFQIVLVLQQNVP